MRLSPFRESLLYSWQKFENSLEICYAFGGTFFTVHLVTLSPKSSFSEEKNGRQIRRFILGPLPDYILKFWPFITMKI